MFSIDIIDIKKEVKEGKLRFYIKESNIYCSNDMNETVKVGELGKEESIND